VTQRTQELGLRLALGARPGELLTLVIGDAFRLVAAGLTLGLLAAAAVGNTMSAFLFRVERFDPAAFLIAAALLLTVSLTASYIPARRASRVDPMTALRSE
jgi:putative ABC transport system permease protein